MRVAIISVFTDYHRKGRHHRGGLQPQIGPLIAGLLPDWCEVEIVNDTWDDPDWTKAYDLVFLSCVHADWDRARQISHYYRRRGARTVLGGSMAGTYPHLCAPYFDAVVIGDPEDTVGRVVEDARANRLQPVYRSAGYFADRVPVPRIAPVARKQVFPPSVEATRGCPYACDFCALTAVGTRHALRPVHTVVRDILAGQAALREAGVAGWKRRLIVFYDNNLAGNLRWFRELCLALKPLDVLWGACLTFNVIANRDARMRVFETLAELGPLVGQTIGTSDWITIDQERINRFADATGDHQWIHVDPERARAGPFGAPIAHGFLTLSLLPWFFATGFEVRQVRMGVNYGLNKVRFPAPVPVGSRLRAHFKLLAFEPIDHGGVQLTVEATIEREGSSKPVCVAESISRRYP